MAKLWAKFKKANGDSGGKYDEIARVDRIEYLMAHSASLDLFSGTGNTPAPERAQQARDEAATGGGGGGGSGGGGAVDGTVGAAAAAAGAAGAATATPPSAAAAAKPRAKKRSREQVIADAEKEGKVVCEWCGRVFLVTGLASHQAGCKKKPAS